MTTKRYQNKIHTKSADLKKVIDSWKSKKQKIVFTNGCFDILHRGHIFSLTEAAQFGNKLVVGLNSDSSVRQLKGASRPVLNEENRASVLAALEVIDAVVIFDELTPKELIEFIIPDVLVKGKDYAIEDIVGADVVMKNGGTVQTIELIKGISTSDIVKKIKQSE